MQLRSSVINPERDQLNILTMDEAPDPIHRKDGDPSAYSLLLKATGATLYYRRQLIALDYIGTFV